MQTTKIAWTEKSWNPVVGCSKISSGCLNCYAERMAKRFQKSQWRPWTKANESFNVRFYTERLAEPLKLRAPSFIFVCSMGDLFHEAVPDMFILKVWEIMEQCPQHTFQILTKRASRMLGWTSQFCRQPLPNVWLGVSVENQAAANWRIPFLLLTPAAIRFVSCEPLLGKIDLMLAMAAGGTKPLTHGKIDWVIVGGETGHGFREMNLDWARVIRDQCEHFKIPFFFKQASGIRQNLCDRLDGVEYKQFPNSLKGVTQ